MICRVCDSARLELAIDLGNQPWANHFLTPDQVGQEPSYPLRVVWCTDCHTAQLDYTVRKEVMFADHTYLSGVTQSLAESFRTVAERVEENFGRGRPGRAVLDVGSNDGTQLKQFQALGWDVLGVESSRRTAQLANAAGVPTVNAFFNLDLVKQINRRFDAVNAAGVFFHLEELHSVTDGIREALTDDGVFVVQFLYMKQIIRNLAFDQIYHEHLLYYNLRTLQALLGRHGLTVFDAYLSPVHGGSVIAFAGKDPSRTPSDRLQRLLAAEEASRCNELATYHRFAEDVKGLKGRNLDFLAERKAAGKTIYGLGAPVKGNTLLNYFGVGPETISYLVERNALRRGLVAPGSHVPLLIEDELAGPPDVYYVLAWNFKEEILRRYAPLLAGGVEFHFPINPVLD
jgi:SAM-dependent methyltransferase